MSDSTTALACQGRSEIALFHYAIDGLMLDHLTTPIDTGLSVDAAIDEFVDRILQ